MTYNFFFFFFTCVLRLIFQRLNWTLLISMEMIDLPSVCLKWIFIEIIVSFKISKNLLQIENTQSVPCNSIKTSFNNRTYDK